ncbi:hypothetical protein VOLCADRAFT_103899 [Volvox carteri f. nagariensis]|uniref:DUF6570 domain-containing protein n=1 Tax=Volvox carteri f. nagariensis TaxID=3068 RepID=D8TPY3_VOLCA|nr:uncharacterized protein VOLCADRAFT_103899 [Volvox carteri f. nagariensis]EFJ50440.1 hypothetical protein VOLCADRAFT_103899 [Volvox carteri f. nagariensis]|eukprot:XP_002948565.1 hypothetical protein VOLCADRAFT_103899 [Volvox carteri f. nagariensis]
MSDQSPASKRLRLGSLADGFRGRIRPFADLSTGRAPEQQQHAAAQQTAMRINSAGPAEAAAADTQLEGQHQDADPSAAEVRERWRRQKAAQRAAALPELRLLQRQQDAARHAAARADPEVRALQQQRNTAQHAAARADPEVRALQQQRNTAQHAAARADPESPASKRLRLGSLADGFRGRIRPFADLSTGRAPEQQQHAAAQQTAVRINSAGPAEAAAADTQLEGQHQDADPSAAEVRERWRRQKAAQRAAALPELRLLQRQQDAARHAAARADPEVRALQQQRNTAQHAAARADPEVRALQQQRNTAQHAAARADPEAAAADTQLEGQHQDADPSAAEVRERWRRQKAAQRAAALPELRLLQRQQDAARHAAARADPEVRALQQQRNTAQHAAARADPEVRALQQQRNTAQHAAARADPEVRVQQQLRDAAQHAASRADPEVRALQQQRNTAQHAAARADPEVRALQQQWNTAQHAAARADPEVRALQQQRNTAQHAAAHADPEVRALQQQRNTARHAAARQVQLRNQQAAPRDTLLARMHRLLRFTDLHRDAAIDLPDFLLAIPEGRVQDLPGGQLPPDRQVPYTVQLQCASTMAVALRRRMPSRVCAVCSEVCSEDQSTVLPWMEIPNVDILRADVMCTDAVQRWGRTLVWRRMARTAQGEAPPPPDPVLPARYRVSRAERVAAVDDDGAGRLVDDAAEGALEMGGDAPETGDLEAAAAEQEPPEQLPPDQQPHPPRVLPRACLDDPASVEVPYCMRLEPDLPNRTMLQLLIMYLADRPPDVFPRAVKTHGIGVVNPDPNMLRGQLPARASDLAGAITVVCVDQVHSRAELLERVRKVPGLQVRGQVIVAWVRFLQHNDEEELAIDEDALQEYERMGCAAGVPDEILHAALAPTDPEVANVLRTTFLHDRTGPVQPTLADPTPNAGHDPGPGPFTAILRGPADQPVEGAPVDPTAATLDELELILPQPSNVGDDGSEIDRFPGRVEDLLTGRARLAFAAGGRDSHVLDDRHPAILTLCFPQSFLYGFSGQRPRGMSFPAYCRHLLHRVPRTQFGGNLVLLARMYDICMRHESMAQPVEGAPVDPTAATLDELELILPQPSNVGDDGSEIDRFPGRVEDLLTGRARLAFAAGGRDSHVLDDRHPAILTLCFPQSFPYGFSGQRPRGMSFPAYCRHLLHRVPRTQFGGNLMLLARITLRLDLTDAYYNGARSKMRAAALTIGWPPLFFTVNPADMHAACAVVASGQVLDFDDDGRPQHIPSTVEKWRRVKDDPYSCAALLVATKEVLVEELFGFAPGAMQQTNPRCFCGLTFEVAVKVEQSGCLALHIHGVAHVATFAVERLQALFSGPNCRALALAYALCAMWYPSPYYDPFTRGAEHYIMDMTVEEAQQHGRAPPPVDKSCPPAAYDFGRLAGCAAAALAFGCNQLFTLACEVDRVYTAEAAAQLARPEDERGDCVLLQPAADRARDSAYYSTKYTGKSINDSQAQLTCNALTRVQDFLLAGRTPNPGASGPTAFGNMCATVHRMTAAITAGMALVAMKLDGHSTFEATFECAYLQVDAFTALSAGADQSPEVATTAAVLVEAEEQEGYTVTNAVHNYVLRGEELSGLDCSVYNLSSNYEVRRPATPPEPPAPTAAATLDQPTSQTATELPRLVAFHGTHPLYRTHVHIRLPRPRYVQLGGSLPRRPRPGTSAAGMAQYYAFVLGTFKAHRGQPIPPGLSVKEAYDTWAPGARPLSGEPPTV